MSAAFIKGVGQAVKTFREAESLDLAGLAKKAGIKQELLERIEQGKHSKVTLGEIDELAAVLRVRPYQIVLLGETMADRQTRKRRRR